MVYFEVYIFFFVLRCIVCLWLACPVVPFVGRKMCTPSYFVHLVVDYFPSSSNGWPDIAASGIAECPL